MLEAPNPFQLLRPWPYQHVLAHYALGTANAHVGNITGAKASLQSLTEEMGNLTGRYLNYAVVAQHALSATVAMAEKSTDVAIQHLQKAVDEQVRSHTG